MARARSTELNLSVYDTDKVDSGFLSIYDYFFSPLIEQEVRMLELGVHRGGSLLMWRDYFPRGTIVGVDINLPPVDFGDRIVAIEGSQDDIAVLDRAADAAEGSFDVIIDDASHVGALTRAGFQHLFSKHLKPGGLYIVEDWGTGYWSDWPDGESFTAGLEDFTRAATDSKHSYSHTAGMVGFVKELVDEVGACEMSQEKSGNPASRTNSLSSLCFFPGLVIARKNPQPQTFQISLVGGRP